MTTDAREIVASERVDARKKFGLYQYYRKADGWITTAPAPLFDEERMRDKGATPLPQYGMYNQEQLGDGMRPLLANRYRYILEKGGAHEFTAEQIIELGWHKRCPVPGIVFPQLEGVTLDDFKCPYCPNRLFYTDSGLLRHTQAMHAGKSEMQELAQSIRDTVRHEAPPRASSPVEVCECGWKPRADCKNVAAAFRMHRRKASH